VADDAVSWRRFVATAFLIALAASAFTLALDLFGIRAWPGRSPAPPMDINQRYMYSQQAVGLPECRGGSACTWERGG
jgi:hypothetical protein